MEAKVNKCTYLVLTGDQPRKLINRFKEDVVLKKKFGSFLNWITRMGGKICWIPVGFGEDLQLTFDKSEEAVSFSLKYL